MCGSGTLPIEASMIANKIAPGLFRNNFAFQKFDNFNKSLWIKLTDNAKNNICFKPNIKILDANNSNAPVNKQFTFQAVGYGKGV